MKQRFSISRNTGGEKIVIKECAELDKGVYSLLCEESYAVEAVKTALAKGPDHVTTLLRTESFFLTRYFAEKLILTLDEYFQNGGSDAVKIDADAAECIHSLPRQIPVEETGGIDDLLDEAREEIIAEDEPVGKLDAPIKIAEDETVEISTSL